MFRRPNRQDGRAGGSPAPAPPDPAVLRSAIEQVEDPGLFAPLGALGTVRAVSLDEGGSRVRVEIAVPAGGHPALGELRHAVSDAVRQAVGAPSPLPSPPPEDEDDGAGVPGGRPPAVDLVTVTLDEPEELQLAERLRQLDGFPPADTGAGTGEAAAAQAPGARAPRGAAARPNVFSSRASRTRVIAVASGKGGVGKSSVTVNLAVALARAGHSVGLLDADIYGFSVPRMLGVAAPPTSVARTIVPPVACGVRVVSMGFFVDEDQAVAWRGPMLHKALEQFLVDVHWGAPDYLVVDMPPGTGDVPLSVAQQLPRAELLVVTTPQPAAQRVAQRAAALAKQLRVPVRGVVENMSFFVAPDGTRYELFGAGGGQALADALGVPLLAQIPLEPLVREGADEGRPAALVDPDGSVAKAFDELARRLSEMGPARVYRSELSVS